MARALVAANTLRRRWPSLTQRTVNRALVHGFLTVLVIVAYALCLFGLAFLLHEDKDAELLVAAAGLVALVAQPLRSFLQRRVDSMMFGDREDPLQADRPASGVGWTVPLSPRRSCPSWSTPSPVRCAFRTWRSSWRARPGRQSPPARASRLERPRGCSSPTRRRASGGWSSALDQRDRRLAAADRRLLEDLARQIGVAARAMQLMHELQRSHVLLVQSRDEERGRLQRDLHDGLGPCSPAWRWRRRRPETSFAAIRRRSTSCWPASSPTVGRRPRMSAG